MRHADLDRDAAICKAMAAELSTYLLKDTLYWQLSDSGPRRRPYPQLTLGGLLMRLHHLESLQSQLSPEAYRAFAQARDETETAVQSWRVHLERKLLVEIPARMRAWAFFLTDCADESGGCADEYPTQAEVRTMLKLLLDRAEGARGLAQLRDQLRGLDRRLRHLTSPGPFVWDPVLRHAYPSGVFWWLYVAIV